MWNGRRDCLLLRLFKYDKRYTLLITSFKFVVRRNISTIASSTKGKRKKKERRNISIRGVFVDGDWNIDPEVVKDVFKDYFATRFKQLVHGQIKLNISFPNRLSTDQVADMDRSVSRDEIRVAVWNCGENKSHGPDGYTFEFFMRYWRFIGSDFCSAGECFFESGSFPKGSNSSFIALIPKVTDAKFVTDFRPISLIGCVYKVVTKILANRLATVISDLVFDIQSAFVANRQTLDGPFILNELLAWCKRKKKQAMIFKVDFAKVYDSVRWDYLLDFLQAFGFGPNWCKWIRGTFSSTMASILVNGSPTSEFPFLCDGIFKGIQIQWSMAISHLFYVDDAVFIEEWSDSNLDNKVKILKCFFLASGLKINIQKSQVLGVGVPRNIVNQAASLIRCVVMQNPFRLTLLKLVLGASPLYNMSIYKVPKGVLKEMKVIRCNFFKGADPTERKITWVSWDKVLASKKNGGLGVSSFHALNRALLLKWVWRFLSQDGSLWYRVIQALYGASFELHLVNQSSIWCSILREMQVLILSVSGTVIILETDKESTVASKLGSSSVDASFRRSVRDGVERQQWDDLNFVSGSVTLSASKDRWICDLNDDGVFRFKEVRTILDGIFLPYAADATRLVKYIPIKINVFAWRARLDRLSTRSNLVRRGVVLDSSLCPLCGLVPEDIHHVLFRCDTVKLVFRMVGRWWDLDWRDLLSFSDWNAWFSAIRLPSRIKLILKGVFYVAWWHLWVYRNRSIFAATPPRRLVIFDDIVSRSFTWIAFIDFADSNGFNKALELSGTEVGGGYINVTEAKPRGDSGGGGRFDSGGRNGGRNSGGRFGSGRGRDGGRGRGRGRDSGGRGRGRGPSRPSMAQPGTGKKTTFGDD
nr:RNA-directed DNA polymerase, eukaryota [Tanacetum cinerariifolium]